MIHSTVKLVYKDHPGNQHNMVFVHRWSLYTLRFNNMESMPLGTCKIWPL